MVFAGQQPALQNPIWRYRDTFFFAKRQYVLFDIAVEMAICRLQDDRAGQPDASFMRGLCPFMAVARPLESRGRTIATHSWGAGASLMQNIHCGFACDNTIILEVTPGLGPLHLEVMGDSFVMSDGHILPPKTLGLGVTLTDDIKNRFPFIPGTGEFNDVPGKVLTT